MPKTLPLAYNDLQQPIRPRCIPQTSSKVVAQAIPILNLCLPQVDTFLWLVDSRQIDHEEVYLVPFILVVAFHPYVYTAVFAEIPGSCLDLRCIVSKLRVVLRFWTDQLEIGTAALNCVVRGSALLTKGTIAAIAAQGQRCCTGVLDKPCKEISLPGIEPCVSALTHNDSPP